MIRRARHFRSWLLLAALGSASVAAGPVAAAPIDLTGTWQVSPPFPVAVWDFAQTGSQLALTFRGAGSAAGSIDTGARAFHIDLGAQNVECGSDTLDGTVAIDGDSLTATLTLYDGICHPLYIFSTGQRCTDSSATNCPVHVPPQPQCGNGILESPEQCDDGNQTAGDFCPANCRYTSSLIRGDRRLPAHDRSGCQVEWYVVNPANPPDRFGQPSMDQVCEDQDPTCDFDPLPGRCRFEVVVCVNNHDPNLPACLPGGVFGATVLPPRASRFRAVQDLGTAAAARLEAALQGLLDPTNPATGYTHAPPLGVLQSGFCSAPFPVDVLSGPRPRDSRFGAITLRTRSFSLSGLRRQRSRLHLTCAPRRLP